MNDGKVCFCCVLKYAGQSKTKSIDITYPNTIIFVNSEDKGVLQESTIKTGDSLVSYTLHSFH